MTNASHNDEFANATVRRVLVSFITAPLLFCAVMGANAYVKAGHVEPGLYVLLYVMTAVLLFLPAVGAGIGIALLPPSRIQTVFAVTMFFATYIAAQLATYLQGADALSSPLPDDPPFGERLTEFVWNLEPPVLVAIAVASLFAIWIGTAGKQRAGSAASGS